MNLPNFSLANLFKLFLTLLGITFLSNEFLHHFLKNYFHKAIASEKIKNDDFLNKTNFFKTTIQFDCDSKKFELNESCLLKLEQLDSYNLGQNDWCDKCFFYPNMTKPTKVYHHTFWHFDQFDYNNNQHKNRLRMINLNLMSYLATQNLCCTKFIFWKLINFPMQLEKLIREFFSYYINKDIIEIRTFSVEEFCQSGFFKRTICSGKPNYPGLNGHYLVAFSDMVRFAVLDKYPGIYTDGDTIYLKDMRFLWYINFAYRWSFLNSFNTAVIGFNKHLNPSLSELINSINKDSSTIGSLIAGFHPDSITRQVNSLNKFKTVFDYDSLLNLHSHFFDGAWLCNDGQIGKKFKSDICGFREFSSLVLTHTFEPWNFFKGAYADHLHYKETAIETNSYFFHFENYYLNFVNNLDTTFYKQFHNLTNT